MPDLFKEIVPSILQSKKNVFEDDPDHKDYNPFIVNRALSFHSDCIPYVEEMNRLHFLDKDMQYQYLIHSIRPMKRKFPPWQKAKWKRIFNISRNILVTLIKKQEKHSKF